MKSNLISAIAGWKSAALLALVAMVAAVAFSGVLTNSADAQTPTPLTDNTADVVPGGTVAIDGGTATIMEFKITGGTATGEFANGEQTIVCSDRNTGASPPTNLGSTCDTNGDAAGITVVLTTDADTSDGYIIITRTKILPVAGESPPAAVVTVTTQPKPASLTAKAISTTIDANGAVASVGDAGRTEIVATVKNDQSPAAGMNDQRVTFVTTLGVMDCPASGAGATAINAATNVQWCQVWTSNSSESGGTAADGNAVISLKASGREGTATVTISHATLDSQSLDITLFGTAKSLEAEAEQGSVEVGGKVFVVLTVKDGAGNPVKNVQPQPSANPAEVVGPAEQSNKVTTGTAADDGDAATSPYNVNKDVDADGVVDKGDIPACGPVTNVAAAPDADPPVQGVFASTGTNDAGQCVVEVTATKDTGATAGTPADTSATLGEHTLNFVLGDLKASASIIVAGGPASIETDPADGSYIDGVTDHPITLTVRDADGNLVGEIPYTVVKVAGDGIVDDGADAISSGNTDNGVAKFTYTSGLAPDTAVFRITVGNVGSTQTVTIQIHVGEPAPEPEPEPEGPPPTWSDPIVSGWNQVTWDGEDGASVADNVGEDVTAVHQWNVGTQRFESWFAGTEGIPSTVNDFSELENGGIYWVYSE